MVWTAAPVALAIGSGSLIGLILGLIGGGGSILAVPLLVYAVGVPSAHVAIGTAAIAVALNAAIALASHARAGNVKWRCASVFAGAGIAGAAGGAALGKAVDGERLLAMFGVLMIVVGLVMLRKRANSGNAEVRLTRESAAQLLPALLAMGGAVGFASGFFGIGGGFLIVPGLMLATGMPLRNAVATSLVAVTAFGLTTAASYAASGFVDWTLAALVVSGGVAGGIAGARLSGILAGRKRALDLIFSAIVTGVGIYVVVRGLAAFQSFAAG